MQIELNYGFSWQSVSSLPNAASNQTNRLAGMSAQPLGYCEGFFGAANRRRDKAQCICWDIHEHI